MGLFGKKNEGESVESYTDEELSEMNMEELIHVIGEYGQDRVEFNTQVESLEATNKELVETNEKLNEQLELVEESDGLGEELQQKIADLEQANEKLQEDIKTKPKSKVEEENEKLRAELVVIEKRLTRAQSSGVPRGMGR